MGSVREDEQENETGLVSGGCQNGWKSRKRTNSGGDLGVGFVDLDIGDFLLFLRNKGILWTGWSANWWIDSVRHGA